LDKKEKTLCSPCLCGKNKLSKVYPVTTYLKRPSIKTCLKAALVGLLAVLIISVIILSCVPPVSRDALIHHLGVLKLYLEHGGVYEIPSFVFSYYPMNLDLLYIIPLYFGNDIIPKFIHFSFALLTAWLIFGYLRKRINALYALLGAFFFLSLPVIVKLSITVYVDLGLIFFSTASLLLLLTWLESGFRLKFLIFSAIFSGLAMGTKYNGLIIFFLLTLFVPFIHSRYAQGEKSRFSESTGQALIFLFIALVVFSPWMIRNYMWTNNPIFPLYDNWFNPANSGLTGGSTNSAGPWGHFAVRSIIFKESWWEIALIPVRIFFQGQDGNPKYFDGRLNPFLFFLPFFAFYHIKNNLPVLRTEKNILLAFVILFLSFAFFKTDMRIRYIAPIIPPLVILSVFGLHEINTIINNRCSATSGKICMGSMFVIVSFLIWMNAAYILGQFRYVDPISYISGRVERDEYIERYRPEYSAIKYANKNLPNNAKILCIFLGNRGYYSDREMVFDRNQNLFRKTVKSANSPGKILLDLNKRGITHLLVRYDLFNTWSNNNFDDEEKEMVGEFFKEQITLLFSKGGYGLFRLGSHT